MSLTESALLLIEFQYEWLNEKGKLHHLMEEKAEFLASIQQAANALQYARDRGIKIIHSGLAFSDNYQELGSAQYGLRAVIPKRQTFLRSGVGSEFVAPFQPKIDEFVVSGRVGGSAFAGSNLDIFLRQNHIQRLYIMGYALHVCVESSFRAAHDLGYDAILIADASCAFNQEQRNHVLKNSIRHFGEAITTETFLTIK